MIRTIPLTHFPLRRAASIASVDAADVDLCDQLGELGFTPGEEVEVLARGVVGGSPLAVRLGRATVALRLDEASAIMVAAE